MKMRRTLAALAVVLAISGVIVYRYIQLGKKLDADQLCTMAEDYHMHCVKLASPAIYDHGAYIRLDPTMKDNKQISLPSDYIFSGQCSFAPASTAFAQFKEDPSQYVAFGNHVYKIDRNLSAGAELSLPRVAGLSLKAGPKVSDIRSVVLEAESAHYFNIDTAAFLTALSGCSVRPSCASVVKQPNVHVIKRLLVAKNLKYRIETAGGETESLAAAVRSAGLSVGVDTSSSSASVDDLSSGKDMVFAIDFFDPAELQTANVCQKSLAIIKVTGTTTATAFSGAQGYKGDNKASADGSETVARERAPDAPGRKFDEGMKDPEAQGWGLWNYEAATQTVALYQRTQVDPGTRWLSDSHLKEIAGSLRVWAIPRASITNTVEVTLVNELEETKVLVVKAKLIVNTSASLFGKLPMYSSFKPLTLISQDGTEHQVPPVWSSSDSMKEFDLGPVGPGEIVKVRVGRSLESTARMDDQAGAIKEDISLTFSLK